ncbi:hypothetical protein N0V88_002011 [Collariella sp. IMI 366227]|nr:hypothetical protein N0V88_002011 [Collariella sp. IMI 366227]
MEKAHQWVYVRSKSKGKRSAVQLRAMGAAEEYVDMAVDAHHSKPAFPYSPQHLNVPPPNTDFILYDTDQGDAMGEDDDQFYSGYGDAQGAESYLPWTSPGTRLRKNEQLIETFSQTYHGAHDKASSVTPSSESEAGTVFLSPIQHGLPRHLNRPAHSLRVTPRVISSFDVADPAFRHPRAGICRTCWRTFSDRQKFDIHVSLPCEKVSKGKREKWRILFDTFTPLLDSTDDTFPGIDESQEPEAHWDSSSEQLDAFDDEGLGHDEAGTPSTSVPSPMLFPSPNFGHLDATDERFVSAAEHRRLQQENQALRQRSLQLERMARALLSRELMQATLEEPTATSDVKPPAADDSKNNPRLASLSDRESLFQHMDSQSTDVDRDAFMVEMEDTHQSLSRTNSGLSTASQSTIHRVPPSPPPRSAELPGQGNCGDATPQNKHNLAHGQPLPSIADSGYGTEQRRGSLGDLPLETAQQQVAQFRPMTPPSSREQPEDAKMLDGVAWGDSPSQRLVRVNTVSSHSSQQTDFMRDLPDHYMVDFDDPFNPFFGGIQRRPSPPGFTFDSGSQTEQ